MSSPILAVSNSTLTPRCPAGAGVRCTSYQPRYQPRPATVRTTAPTNARRFRMALAPPVRPEAGFGPASHTPREGRPVARARRPGPEQPRPPACPLYPPRTAGAAPAPGRQTGLDNTPSQQRMLLIDKAVRIGQLSAVAGAGQGGPPGRERAGAVGRPGPLG